MDPELKLLVALLFFLGGGPLCLLLASFSQRLRDVALFVMVFGAVLMTRADLTFAGEFWYRGTSRGIQVAMIDLAPVCLIGATLLFPRYERGRFYWPAGLGLILVFFAYCVVSVLASQPQHYGVWELAKWLRGIMYFLAAALFVRTRRELAVAVIALSCAVGLEAFNAVEQRLFKASFRPPGTLDHANTLSTYLCLVAPVLIAAAMSKWSKALRWFAGTAWLLAAGAELMTLSRMGIPVFFLVSTGTALACTSFRLTKRKLATALAMLAVVGGLAYAMGPNIKARYSQSNIRAELTAEGQLETRGVYWRTAIMMIEDHPMGVGLNNWSYYVSKTYGRLLGTPYADYDDFKWIPTANDATSTFLPPAADSLPSLLIGELGIAGFALFLLMWFRWFQMSAVFLGSRLNDDPMHRVSIGLLFGSVGTLLQSATEWTFLQPGVFFTATALMGVLAGLHRHRRLLAREAKSQRAADRAAPSPSPWSRDAPVPVS